MWLMWQILVLGVTRLTLEVTRELSAKVRESLLRRCDQMVELPQWDKLTYFHGMLDNYIDLVDRRLGF